MKTLFQLLFLSLVFVSCTPRETASTLPAEQPAPAFNEEAEKQALLATIEQETKCFYARDYDCWKQNWVQGDHTFQAWNNADGTYDASQGWNAVDERIGKYIREHPLQPGMTTWHPKVERRNMVVKFYSDSLAYMAWDQYNGDETSTYYMISKDTRIMEKHNGKWQIANVTALWDYNRKIPIDSLQ